MRMRFEVIGATSGVAKFPGKKGQPDREVSFLEMHGVDTDAMDRIYSVRIYKDSAGVQAIAKKGAVLHLMFRTPPSEFRGKYTITVTAADVKLETSKATEARATVSGNGAPAEAVAF